MTGTETPKAETPKGPNIDLKLKAKMVNVGELNYTLQLIPSNIEWKYSEAEAEYKIDQYIIKSDNIKQIIRNLLFKNKELLMDSVKVGSKDFLFEVQVPKRIEKEKLKQVFAQIANEIKSEVVKSRTELESFKKLIDESEF